MAQLLSNLPVGAKLKFGKYSVNGETAQSIIWTVVAKNHTSTPAYPSNAMTLITEKVIDFRAIDAQERTNTDGSRRSGGNNRYSVSNMDQWLNKDSGAGQWYAAQHTYDQSPNSSYVSDGTPYDTSPGFLNAFSAYEKNAILTTPIRVARTSVDGGGYEDVSRKVFIPSAVEVGITAESGIIDGTEWSYFSNHNTMCWMTSQAYNYTTRENKPASASEKIGWWTRTPLSTDSTHIYAFANNGDLTHTPAYNGSFGLRPALNLSPSVRISDTTDNEGCYTIIPNVAPTTPSGINVPTVYGGKTTSISWGKSTDADGDTITYQLECSTNGGGYSTIYTGASTSYTHIVPFGTTSVVYRVKSVDPSGESSAYVTSATFTVINNTAPVISGSDANLGVKTEGFTGTYTVTDANNNAVTVTEAIDGVQIRSLVATLGQAITYGVNEHTWLVLPNGSHTLTISATDGIDTTVRTYTFTKLVDSLKIQSSTPWETSTQPTRIMLVVTRNIPSAASFKVEVCNNGYDSSPTWEDCTDAVRSGLVHVFTNTSKTASKWGVCIRVTVERNGATGACYISAIGGNFE